MSDKIPIFPILYKPKNNKIYQWSIEINKINNEKYQLLYSHGQKDGKITSNLL